MDTPILVAEKLQMTFSPADSPLEALGEASFLVMPNEFVCIIGPSGCGKSTLLRILAGLVRPTSGRVVLSGRLLTEPQRRVGLMFQRANLMPWRSALRNVMLPLEIQGVPREESERRAKGLLEAVGLSEFGGALPRELSGGMRQRVSLARALVHDPDILLLDEPFGALDALTRERLNVELLRVWRSRRKTVIMVTHNIQEAVFLADRVLTMSARPGRLECEIPIDLARPRTIKDLYAPHFLEHARRVRESLN